MGIEAAIERQFALDEIIAKANRKKELKDRLRRDMIRVKQMMDDLKRTEAALDAKLSITPKFSGKWWHLLGQLNVARRDWIDGRNMAEEFKAMILAIDNGTVGIAT